MSEANPEAKIFPIRPAVGLVAVSVIAASLAVLTARDANRTLELHQELHDWQAPFAPSLLYGGVVWIWWVVVMLVLWKLANRWTNGFKPSALTITAHLGVACALATAHLALLERTIRFSSWYWPAWGRHYAGFCVLSLERFGVELVIYGFISGICAFLHSRMQTQQALVQKVEVGRQLTQAQLKALQMQMEPHFLFNTLNALTSWGVLRTGISAWRTTVQIRHRWRARKRGRICQIASQATHTRRIIVISGLPGSARSGRLR
jgi:hypothetical protein